MKRERAELRPAGTGGSKGGGGEQVKVSKDIALKENMKVEGGWGKKKKIRKARKWRKFPQHGANQGQVCEIRDPALWLWNASEEPVRVGAMGR